MPGVPLNILRGAVNPIEQRRKRPIPLRLFSFSLVYSTLRQDAHGQGASSTFLATIQRHMNRCRLHGCLLRRISTVLRDPPSAESSSPLHLIMLSLALFALLCAKGTTALTCGGDKPLSLCCMGVGPWSSNSQVWGDDCGYFPSNPNELVGGRCIGIDQVGGTW